MLRFRHNLYVYVSGTFGIIWVLMTWQRPGTSYYMFPLLISAAVPVSYRLVIGRALPLHFTVGSSVAGLFNVLMLSGILAISGKLDGPTLLPTGGNVVDSLSLGLIGAIIGGFLAMFEIGSNRTQWI